MRDKTASFGGPLLFGLVNLGSNFHWGNMATDQQSDPNVQSGEVKPKKSWTWERTIEISKIVATLYAACLGTFVTMQFNERQHELARIEAIAKMLPSLAAKEVEEEKLNLASAVVSANANGKADKKATDALASELSTSSPSHKIADSKRRMVRDGAIWAIFRTAQNKNMLRDLANLFPEDIYRVVSSIAASGGLEHDEDEIMALQIASEKLGNKYMDENENVLAAKLYNQALRLKERLRGQVQPLFIVDLNDKNVEELPDEANADREAALLGSLNKLGDIHSLESEESHKVNTGHFQSKQLYNRVRNLGKNSSDPGTRLEVARADEGLARLYEREKRYKTAAVFLREALKILKDKHTESSPEQMKIETELQRVSALIGRQETPTSEANAKSSVGR